MREEVKNELVAALRSGEYKQLQGKLKGQRTTETDVVTCHCCLGVLCDIASKHGIGTWDANTFVVGKFEDSLLLPDEVVKWAGMYSRKGTLPNRSLIKFDHFNSLIVMNDNDMSFNEIADVIEKEWENL